MNAIPQIRRRDLYGAYRHELLVDITGAAMPESERETDSWFQLLTQNPSVYAWHDIVEAGKLIGFFVVCIKPAAVHGADFALVSAYTRPASRQRGRMSGAVGAYVNEHPGIWVLTVKQANLNALRFWPGLFERLGYRPAGLSAPFGFLSDDETMMSFRPEK